MLAIVCAWPHCSHLILKKTKCISGVWYVDKIHSIDFPLTNILRIWSMWAKHRTFREAPPTSVFRIFIKCIGLTRSCCPSSTINKYELWDILYVMLINVDRLAWLCVKKESIATWLLVRHDQYNNRRSHFLNIKNITANGTESMLLQSNFVPNWYSPMQYLLTVSTIHDRNFVTSEDMKGLPTRRRRRCQVFWLSMTTNGL